MRILHSAWTKPWFTGRWHIHNQLEGNMWLYALSVAYAKRNQLTIVLHTDNLGKELFSVLPYDEIHTTLEGMQIHDRLWAAGKFKVMEVEETPFIHIDGDVFIKEKKTVDALNFEGYDLIVQNLEGEGTPDCLGDIYNNNIKLLKRLEGKFPKELKLDGSNAYCCGLIGFNNRELKERYIAAYKEMSGIILSDPDIVLELDRDKDICPDLIMEQVMIHNLAEYYGYKVKLLLPGKDVHKDAVNIGFTHVIGSVKYQKIDLVKERLNEVNPEIYKNVENLLKQYQPGKPELILE